MEGHEGESVPGSEPRAGPIDNLTEHEKEKMEQYWTDKVDAYSNLWELVQERHEELLGALGLIDSSSPYLMGFETGLRTGCQLSQDLIVVAIDQAANKEHVLPDELRSYNNECLHALSVAASRQSLKRGAGETHTDCLRYAPCNQPAFALRTAMGQREALKPSKAIQGRLRGMAQIFVSHSQKDDDLRRLFADAFAGTKVRGVFEEFEEMERGSVSRDHIILDLNASNAVFVVLSHNVQNIPHTRDWVCWESGCSTGKDVWVFEPRSQLGSISVVIPGVRHYVVLEDNARSLSYLRSIVNSYDDSNVLLASLIGAALGAAAGGTIAKKDKGAGQAAGALVGGAGGYLLTDKSRSRPQGVITRCPDCSSVYNVHTAERVYRCPICNQSLELG